MKTIVINSMDDAEKYYNANTNTYIFSENGERCNVKIKMKKFSCAHNIIVRNIDALDIVAGDIDAWNIDVWDIDAQNINAYDIYAQNIDANDISYYAVCIARQNIVCHKIHGRREDSVHMALDGTVRTGITKEMPSND